MQGPHSLSHPEPKEGFRTKRTCWPRIHQPCELTTCQPAPKTANPPGANPPGVNPPGANLPGAKRKPAGRDPASYVGETWARRGRYECAQDVVETWARRSRDVGETWARRGQETWALYYYETWAKQWFRPPRAHVFYLMIS